MVLVKNSKNTNIPKPKPTVVLRTAYLCTRVWCTMQHRTVVVIIPLISPGQEFRFVVEQSKAVPEQPALAPSVCTTDPRLRRCRPAGWCRTLQAASDSSTLTSRSSYDTCVVMATKHVAHWQKRFLYFVYLRSNEKPL